MGASDKRFGSAWQTSVGRSSLSRLFSTMAESEATATRMKSVAFLLLFVVLWPVVWAISAVTLAVHAVRRVQPCVHARPKRILVSGGGMTKSLQLARSLFAAGHQVYLAEEYAYTPHRFSRSVTKFCLCVDTKMHQPYIDSIVEIVRREKIDVFIPVSHSWCECDDSLVKEALRPLNCETVQGDLHHLHMLSDKFRFISQAQQFGLTVPKTFRITSRDQVLQFDFGKEKCRFILKSLVDNNLTRWQLKKLPCADRQELVDYLDSLTISEESPWILQQFIPGKEFCTHGTVRDGELRLYACCASSSWLLRYKHREDKPLIFRWVKEFCSRVRLTGQASFDFIESDEDGRPYALECNPRTHTAITAFYDHPRVAEAYLDATPLAAGPIQPSPTARQTYWLHHELWNLLRVRSVDAFLQQISIFLHGQEAIHSVDDPLPFLLHYTFHMPCVLLHNLLTPVPFQKVDCNLGLLL